MASGNGFTENYQLLYPRVMGYLLRRVDVAVARELAETFTHRDPLAAELAPSPPRHNPGADALALERVVVVPTASNALIDGARGSGGAAARPVVHV